MTPASPMPLDPARRPARTASSNPRAEVERLQAELDRMRLYAHVLEERCNRLWRYVPDTHGTRDPVLPFLALHCSMADVGERRD